MSKNFFSMGFTFGFDGISENHFARFGETCCTRFQTVFRLYRPHRPPFYIYSLYLFDALAQVEAGFFPPHII